MSLKKFIFSQADQPVVKPKEEVDHTYKNFALKSSPLYLSLMPYFI